MLHHPMLYMALLLLLGSVISCTGIEDRDMPEARDTTRLPQTAPPELTGTEWELVSIDQQPVLPGSRVTFEITPETAGGYAGCNWFGGEYTITADTIAISNLARNEVYCAQPEGVMEQEDRYLELLHDTLLFEHDGDMLELRNRDGATVLTFRARTALAMDPAALVDSHWQLERTSDGRPVADLNITLHFARDSISGFGGCRDYVGLYNADGDRIRFPMLSMLETECNDADRLTLEGDYTTGLSETTNYRLDSNRLELHTVGGDTLRFRVLK